FIRMEDLMNKKIFDKALHLLLLVLLLGYCLPTALAQDTSDESIYSFSGDAALVSKYMWRGQRLTNDWSLQPAVTVGLGAFSFNVWGTIDLTAVNEGDALFLPQRFPLAPPGDHSGLQGKFSEVDYTFSFAHSFETVSIDVGTIFYTFPDRSASLATTTELYGGITFETVPLAPSATLYVDVEETGEAGDTGIYFLLGAGHSFTLPHNVFSGVDLSGSLAFVNGGFGEFYYGASEAGAHDFNFTISAPISLGENWSASAFVSYSALLGDFRDFQFQDPREVLRGTARSPATFADTVWGGFTLSLAF
ncbi:hypothetical protein MYX75_04905, partial [Acidobacteria bacterium AH-259-A15]|nr:hypothetical protein [Acidobacteria bacterium AH-259-A15]